MNKVLLSALLGTSAMLAFAANKGQNDPTVMTINGEDVPLSEFEYLYNKNNSQQIEPLTFDEYVGMFVDYKLKVADARAHGMDTTQTFIKEFAKFRDELAAPYLVDTATQNRLIREQYQRMTTERKVSHIMLPLDKNPGDHNEQRLDSIRQLIVSGKEPFESLVRYTVDRSSAQKKGSMGWITSNGSLPWVFEEAAYNTPIGEISPVINSGYGYHIVRPEAERPQRGEVCASHILLMTKGKSPEQVEMAKEKIDSIYQLAIVPGADFAALAKEYSEDPGSARNGGDLGWFGGGKMVAEFDSVAFTMPVGEISKPFQTAFGYHIIKKTAERGAETKSLEELKPQIEAQMTKDGRARLALDVTADRYAAKCGAAVNPNLKQEILDFLAEKNVTTCDTANLRQLIESGIIAYTVPGEEPKTLRYAMRRSPLRPDQSPYVTAQAIEKGAKQAMDNEMLGKAREDLMASNEDFRNLVNEYRDGILLFDISNQTVWEKASKDSEGLEAFYQANKDKYTWDKPHFKGYVIMATNDSICQLALTKAEELFPTATSPEDFQAKLKKQFGNQIRVERVVAAQGENPIIDYLGFGGPKPENTNQRLQSLAAFKGQVIDQPQEASDVKGQVVTDYQNVLEQEWLKKLHDTYPVKINEKNLKKAQKAK
ncbi:MAG: peptidylprolyl isomerase [Bacteroidales bacterium]|nr:peptidylprolyl isomerase [Bacteroidales bacterium]